MQCVVGVVVYSQCTEGEERAMITEVLNFVGAKLPSRGVKVRLLVGDWGTSCRGLGK